MSGIVEVKREIRRALQIPLAAAAAQQTPPVPVVWTGVQADPKDDSGSHPRFFTVELVWGDVQVLEMGPTPRFMANGGLSITVRTPIRGGEDQNDRLSAVVAKAYPYASVATFEGVTVHIDKSQPGPYVEDGAWLASLVVVDWECFRRP